MGYASTSSLPVVSSYFALSSRSLRSGNCGGYWARTISHPCSSEVVRRSRRMQIDNSALLTGGWQHVFHAAETEVIRSSAHLAFAPSAHHVARAILIGAQERTSPLSFLPFVRFARVVGRSRALGISRYAGHIHQLLVVIRAIPIARPLPHIPGHIIKTVAVRWKTPDCCDPRDVVF